MGKGKKAAFTASFIMREYKTNQKQRLQHVWEKATVADTNEYR